MEFEVNYSRNLGTDKEREHWKSLSDRKRDYLILINLYVGNHRH